MKDTALLKVDFGSLSHSGVLHFYSTLSRVNTTVTRLHLGGRTLIPSATPYTILNNLY